MQKLINTLLTISIFTFLFTACTKEDTSVLDDRQQISEEVLFQIKQLGFSTKDVIKVEDGYIVEGDIVLHEEDLDRTDFHENFLRIADTEQYRTTNLVTGLPRVIKMYAQQGTCNSCYSAGMIAGLDMAIARYNAQGLQITFQRVTSATGADIVMTRLKKGEENRGILGSAGFPTASGDPYNQIKMSGVLESKYGLSTEGIATIIAHEMGHCIGFRHTDYFNRAISCGGSASNEGASTVGAIHIPGTPTGATLADLSWMLACTNGGDRPFNSADQIALDYLY